ncbi:MAG: DUF547 domain-containing protein [Saprospiraceae bacterium]|nr:DUF547 domain-containing protein [Saprospiraceae bacterium]MDW8229406.1 DUF547 domain-containing protein [Saprospiraceae bacterium]
MKKILFLLIALLAVLTVWFTCANCRAIRRDVDSRPVSHERWDALLRKYVSPEGLVRYRDFLRDSAELNAYLRLLESAHPNEKTWTRAEQMAYWINAYNAYTVQLILRHYPVSSIKDIKSGIAFVNSVWDIKFIRIQGYEYDLNNIEHNILRPVFKDARIHAAINCASYSCPPLRNEAFLAERLDAQLDDAMRRFISDPLRNRIGPDKAEVSKIFSWFSGDFERDAGSVRAYLNRYLSTPIGPHTPLTYLDYNWALNEAK